MRILLIIFYSFLATSAVAQQQPIFGTYSQAYLDRKVKKDMCKNSIIKPAYCNKKKMR